MKTPYSLRDQSVLYEGREDLKRAEASGAVIHALRRKLRLARYDKDFFRTLDETGEATITWNFTRFNTENEDAWVTFHAWADASGDYRMHCVGPKADDVIDRVNRAIFNRAPKWLRKKIDDEEIRRKKSRRFRLRRAKRKKKQAEAPVQIKKPRKGRRYVTSHALEHLTPQFRKSRIFWNEALDATVAAFSIRRDAKHSAREIAARRLYRSLEHTGYQFAQYRVHGFCLQFTTVDGRWKGMGLTAATVSCTKNNRHPVYRRLRTWLKKTLHHLPEPEMRSRREFLFDTTQRYAA